MFMINLEREYVGPFLNFTSVVGPNGSGKSSIFDAIIFCLSAENSRKNYYDPTEFITRRGQESQEDLVEENRVT